MQCIIKAFSSYKNFGIFWDKNISILPNRIVPMSVFSYAVTPFLYSLIVTMSVTTHFPENFIF